VKERLVGSGCVVCTGIVARTASLKERRGSRDAAVSRAGLADRGSTSWSLGRLWSLLVL